MLQHLRVPHLQLDEPALLGDDVEQGPATERVALPDDAEIPAGGVEDLHGVDVPRALDRVVLRIRRADLLPHDEIGRLPALSRALQLGGGGGDVALVPVPDRQHDRHPDGHHVEGVHDRPQTPRRVESLHVEPCLLPLVLAEETRVDPPLGPFLLHPRRGQALLQFAHAEVGPLPERNVDGGGRLGQGEGAFEVASDAQGGRRGEPDEGHELQPQALQPADLTRPLGLEPRHLDPQQLLVERRRRASRHSLVDERLRLPVRGEQVVGDADVARGAEHGAGLHAHLGGEAPLAIGDLRLLDGELAGGHRHSRVLPAPEVERPREPDHLHVVGPGGVLGAAEFEHRVRPEAGLPEPTLRRLDRGPGRPQLRVGGQRAGHEVVGRHRVPRRLLGPAHGRPEGADHGHDGEHSQGADHGGPLSSGPGPKT